MQLGRQRIPLTRVLQIEQQVRIIARRSGKLLTARLQRLALKTRLKSWLLLLLRIAQLDGRPGSPAPVRLGLYTAMTGLKDSVENFRKVSGKVSENCRKVCGKFASKTFRWKVFLNQFLIKFQG